MHTISIMIEVKDENGEDAHVCNVTLSGSMNPALKLIETLVKEEFDRPDSRISHLSIKRATLVYD